MLTAPEQVKVHGRGESKFPLTSVHDIAAWLPDALLAPAPAKETYLVGNAVTWNDVVAACGEATGAGQGLGQEFGPEGSRLFCLRLTRATDADCWFLTAHTG